MSERWAGLPDDYDPVLAFTRGDRVQAEQLRRALRVIADHGGDDQVSHRVRAVLDGRMTMRELVRDPVFSRELDAGMSHFAEAWSELTPEERVERGRQGQRETERLRDELGMASDPDPAPVGEFGPGRTDRRPDAP